MKKLLFCLFLLANSIVYAGNPQFSPGSNLAFLPNLGQITTDVGSPASNVHFKASVPGLDFYLTDEGLTYVFVHHNGDEYDPALGGAPNPNFQPTTDFARVDMVLKNANLNPQTVRSEQQTEDYTNFYLGHCPEGRTEVHGYYRIVYPDVYPNIDWVIYSEDGQKLKYEFVVHQGGDPSQIEIEYRYADLDVRNDAIHLSTPMGRISEQKLYAYIKENQTAVPAHFIASGNTVKVDVAAPSSGTLIIDPPLEWATYYGSSGDEQPQALVTSLNGFVFVAGYTNTTNFPTINPGGGAYFAGTAPGSTDAFWVKFDTLGVRYWATYYGGSGAEGSTSYTGISIACGLGTDFWVLGTTASTNLPTQNPGGGAYFQATNAGGTYDFFIAKFSIQTGVRQYSTYMGGSGIDGGLSHGNGADCDAAGNFYFSGIMNSTNFPLLNPGGGAYFDNTQNGSNDLCIVKMNPNGQLIWSTIYGGSSDDMNYSMDLHVDRANAKLYVGTNTSSTNMPCVNPGGGAFFDNTLAGGTDSHIARFSLNGVQEWGSFIGGSADEWLSMSLATAPDGDLAMITLTGSTNMPLVNPGGTAFHDNSQNGSWDMYLARFETNLSMSWSTYYGSSNNDHCQHNLTMDFGGRIIMCGVSDGTVAPVVYNPGSPHYFNGVKDAQGTYCLVQYDTDGTMLWGTFYGGSGHDHLFGTVGGCIGVSAHSDIFVSAETNSTNLPLLNPGNGAYFQSANAGGGKEGFVLKFNNDIIPIILAVGMESFTGQRIGSENVLNWKITENHSANRFLIERETEGSFEQVGGIVASQSTSYTWTDINPQVGANRYRLKIYDQDGYFSYSNIVEIKADNNANTAEFYPNPTKDKLWIKLETDGNQELEVKFFDLTGREVFSDIFFGSGAWLRDFSSLGRGTYLVKVIESNSGNMVHQGKVILQ